MDLIGNFASNLTDTHPVANFPWHGGKSTNLTFVTNGKACPEKPRSSRGAAKLHDLSAERLLQA
jgi:hypothetical protein